MENLKKIRAIAWKELYTTFTDRNLILIMVVTPVAIASIVALAFGGGGGDISIKDIPVALVNLDKGVETGGVSQNFGTTFVDLLIPPADSGATSTAAAQPDCGAESEVAASGDSSGANILLDLTEAVALDDPAVARAGVDNGEYTAAVIIPEDFTQRISYGQNDPIEPTSIEVYANAGRAITAGIIRSIVESYANQIATGNIAIAATIDTLVSRAQTNPAFGLQFLSASQDGSFQPDFSCAFTAALNTIKIEQQTLAGQQQNNTVAILVIVGSAQAMFFALFTGQGSVNSIQEERRAGTLQRLFVSPTPRAVILTGKLIGAFVLVVFQLVVLLVALTLVGSLTQGSLVFIWGSDILAVALVVLCVALCVSGLSILLAGIARTPEQAAIYGSVVNLGLALLGGAFGFQLPQAIAQISLIYWGTNAFSKLSANQGDVGLNLVILLAQGVVLFVIGLWVFNRRLEA